MEKQQFFATAPLGMEPLLATELEDLGAVEVKQERAGVRFSGDLKIAYTACLWSRLASRILLPLVSFEALDPDQLYTEVLKIDWSEQLSVENTLAVDCTLVNSKINHSLYAALRVKDAIVDQFRS
ncbi:MAG: THUMP domain-containing protein, partial [Desulfuromusa sp.]|nr:THUMP domain-containing protein [Desulfuromusa sp.]